MEFLDNGPLGNEVIEEKRKKLDLACDALKQQADFRLERLKVGFQVNDCARKLIVVQ